MEESNFVKSKNRAIYTILNFEDNIRDIESRIHLNSKEEEKLKLCLNDMAKWARRIRRTISTESRAI